LNTKHLFTDKITARDGDGVSFSSTVPEPERYRGGKECKKHMGKGRERRELDRKSERDDLLKPFFSSKL